MKKLRVKTVIPVSLILFGGLIGLQGCLFGGDDDQDHDHDGHAHSVTSGDTVSGMHGMYNAVVTYTNHPEIATDNGIMIQLVDPNGNAVTGASVTAEEWMPEHGHGSPTDPTVMDMDGGMYHITNLNFTMDGTWEVRVGVDNGEMTDMIHITFVITVS